MATAAQRRIKSVSYAKYGYIFVAPFFIVYFIFMLWPLIETFILAFHGNGNSPKLDEAGTSINCFVGLDNFKTILFGGADFKSMGIHERFARCMGNTVIIWGGNFLPQIALSLLLAVWFTDMRVKMPGKGFFKVVMYMPNIITAASVAGLFLTLLSDSPYSVANIMLDKLETSAPGVYGFIEGITNDTMVKDGTFFFSSDKWSSRIIIMFIQVWMWFGNTMIMLMSGIMGINPSLFEAANIDGANSTQVFTKVTLPLLQPIMVYTMITSMIGGLQMFDIPYLYHTAGQKFSRELETVAVYIYYNFNTGTEAQSNYGYAGAASIIIFIITAILGSITFYMNRDKDEIAQKKQRKRAMKQYKAKMKKGGLAL